MARYFFDLHECGVSTRDEEGVECADLAVARERALLAARKVMCAELTIGKLCLACRIDVLDEAGAVALSVPFKDAVAITGL